MKSLALLVTYSDKRHEWTVTATREYNTIGSGMPGDRYTFKHDEHASANLDLCVMAPIERMIDDIRRGEKGGENAKGH